MAERLGVRCCPAPSPIGVLDLMPDGRDSRRRAERPNPIPTTEPGDIPIIRGVRPPRVARIAPAAWHSMCSSPNRDAVLSLSRAA